MFRSHHTRILKPNLSQSGFTLIEALVAVAIIGVLTAIAMPSFTQSIQRYRVNAVRDDLDSSLQLARITAMTQGKSVFLSRIPACTGVTLSGQNDWSCGWRIIVDANENNNVNTTYNQGATPIATSDMLLQTTNVPRGINLIFNPGAGSSFTSIDRWGQLTTRGALFRLTVDGGNAEAPSVAMCISSGGRIKNRKDEIDC